MEPMCSLLLSQERATGIYIEPYESSQCAYTLFS
jgi:hypothetical protein